MTTQSQYPDVSSCESDIVAVFTRYVCVGTVPVKYRLCAGVDTVLVPVKYGKMIAGVAGPTRQHDDVIDTEGIPRSADVTLRRFCNVRT